MKYVLKLNFNPHVDMHQLYLTLEQYNNTNEGNTLGSV